MALKETELPAMARLMRATKFAEGEEGDTAEKGGKEKGAPATKPERLLSL